MYRIRMHGRGGQGIKTAANILGSALFREGFEVQDAPRYGAERRGAPIFAYVRAARAPIAERGIIARPDLVIVADVSLLPEPAAGVLQGLRANTVLLVGGDEPASVWRQRLNLAGPVLALAPDAVAAAPPPYLGAACAGAAARLLGNVTRASLEAAVREELHAAGEAVVQRNLDCACAGFDAMAAHAGAVAEGGTLAAEGYAAPQWVELAAEEARRAAPDIYAPATSELSRTGVWRTLRPVIDLEHCNRCAWICSTFCPDSAIAVDAGRTPRIDYEHCKGCMVCVAVCPPHAIRAVPEHAEAAEGAHA